MLSLILLICILSYVSAFAPRVSTGIMGSRGQMVMEYIPDGLTKAQWAAIKKKEADEAKARGDLSKMGATRFKSRSFEAWQKSGGKHLFPVDPRTTPYEERPYMQRKGGDAEGSDLKKKGLFGRGQGQSSERNALDDYYEDLGKKGKLNSASILGEGEGLPWTSKQLTKQFSKKIDKTKTGTKAGVAKGKLSKQQLEARKKTLFKPIKNSKATTKKGAKEEAAPVEEKPKKKGLFGLF